MLQNLIVESIYIQLNQYTFISRFVCYIILAMVVDNLPTHHRKSWWMSELTHVLFPVTFGVPRNDSVFSWSASPMVGLLVFVVAKLLTGGFCTNYARLVSTLLSNRFCLSTSGECLVLQCFDLERLLAYKIILEKKISCHLKLIQLLKFLLFL